MKTRQLIDEGLADYEGEQAEKEAQRQREAAEIREIQEDIALAEYEVWLRELSDEQLCHLMVRGPNTQLTFERQLAEMNRRIDEWECEAERDARQAEEDEDGSY